MSDVLAVESILFWKNWSVIDWDSIYTDIPSKQMKIQVNVPSCWSFLSYKIITFQVKDRNVIETYDAERQCLNPKGLQLKIDQAVSGFENGRAFARYICSCSVIPIYK